MFPMQFALQKLRLNWRSPEFLLMLMAAAMPLSSATWFALINNFAVERAGFDGAQFGLMQSIREIPGFMAFAAIFLLIFMREQTLALVSLLLLGAGVALTGFFPYALGLYCTTALMSVGFHYYETMNKSLSLQWIEKSRTPQVLGNLIAVGSFTSLLAFALIYAGLTVLDLDYKNVYIVAGGLTCALVLFAVIAYPHFPQKHEQRKKLILRRRYWLYYALTFLSGARRQIFVVFAGFLMVERFGYSAAALTMLFLVNCAINIYFAPLIGKLVGKWGERRALLFEYAGLIVIFASYAFVQHAGIAALLYIADHVFFALAIAMHSYFQKIADPADIASTAGVAFTINHIAAVVLPAVLGLLWLHSPAAVFLCGAALAAGSLALSYLVPDAPEPGNEVRGAHPAPAFGK
ncbi:MAG: MFS transporter [Gammaproteobacteria bacterium]|nr:MFS transporter [Gammaproteobacteria bacterium]